MYITGYSGSGKSTLALSLLDSHVKIIHLDGYTGFTSSASSIQLKDFNRFLIENIQDADCFIIEREKPLDLDSDDYIELGISFREAIEQYAYEQFQLGNRVIVEGIQILDGWLTFNNQYYKDKPIIILQTNLWTSFIRSFIRDRSINLLERIRYYIEDREILKSFSKTVNAKCGNGGELYSMKGAPHGT